jgi:outer membrane protein OmpA-like peptidoglycan-associated protein
MRNAIILLFILLLLWIAGSSHIYVCKIRKDCHTEEAVVPSGEVLVTETDTLQAAAVPEIQVPPLHILYFDFNLGECAITTENTSHFELIKQYLSVNPGKKVRVTGHSDAIGPEWAKEKVSAMRADFVKQQIMAAGVTSDAIETIAESDRKPVSDNSTREGRAKNRRAEILIQ